MVLQAAPPPPALVAVGERPPILSLAPTQAAGGALRPGAPFLTEEEFYREKQRLQNLRRK